MIMSNKCICELDSGNPSFVQPDQIHRNKLAPLMVMIVLQQSQYRSSPAFFSFFPGIRNGMVENRRLHSRFQ